MGNGLLDGCSPNFEDSVTNSTKPDVPFTDLAVGSQDTGLDINGVVPHASQHYRFIQGSYYENGVMALCKQDISPYI